MKITKLSENKIMVKIEVPIFDKDRKIGSSVLKIRYKKGKYSKSYEPMTNSTKSSPRRGLSQKYDTKMNKISITFKDKYDTFEDRKFSPPEQIIFYWNEEDRKRWRNKQIEILLKED